MKNRAEYYRQRYAAHPEKKAESNRRWRIAHPEKAAEYARYWAATHREQRAETSRRWRAAHPGREAENARRWRAAHPEKVAETLRRYRLRAKYGLSLEDYQHMLDEQKGCCALCYRPLDPKTTAHVDHDTTTGKVRGLLHTQCNTAIGLLGHDAMRARLATTYLDKHISVAIVAWEQTTKRNPVSARTFFV